MAKKKRRIRRASDTIPPVMENHSEKRFLQLFEQFFRGADIQGRPDSGFIKLLQMKDLHCRAFWKEFSKRVEQIVGKLPPDAAFRRDEIFDKLHTFFSRYFSESGSVYFHNTPAWQPIYQRVDDPGRDVMMVWKTSMLHYVKTDMTLKNMTVNLDSLTKPRPADDHSARAFAFDVSALPPKQNNERREFLFQFAGKTDDPQNPDALKIAVLPAANGRKTDFAKLAKQAAQASGQKVREDDLREAAAAFLRQSEADYFINRNPRQFLQEQLDIWMFSYALGDPSEFTPARIAQLRAIRQIARLVIEFVAQFENQLLRIWEKPKFARAVNYVVTADRLPAQILKKAANSPGAKAQIAEWRELKLVPENFSMRDLTKGDGALGVKKGNGANGEFQFLPLDTRHFKALEAEILNHLAEHYGGENAVLDRALDGELIHSENWQALNTILPKFKARVKCIYIDPPFNLGDSDQFSYRTNYKDACWATMLEGRLELARELISEDGGIFVRCGHDGNHLVRFLMQKIFGEENYRNEIVVRRAEEQKGELMKQFDTMRAMMVNYDNLYWFSVRPETRFNFITKPTTAEQSKAHWHAFWKAEDRPHLRYNLLGVDLSEEGRGQWMWSEKRAACAVENYRRYLEECGEKSSLEDYWRRTGEKLEFIRRTGSGGKSSVKYWVPPREFVISDNNWMDIKGYANTESFKTENSEALLARIISHLVVKGDLVMDFFAGSGTTMTVAQKLGRRWIGVEMGEHFHTKILPRMKKVLAGFQSGISGDESVDYNGGGAFKYYALEQYEESLANMRYDNEEPALSEPPYMFLRDEKMAWRTEVGEKSLNILLDELHPDIDLAETLSHARGLPIKSRTADAVVLGERPEDWEKETYRIDWKRKMSSKDRAKLLKVLRPYLWWE